MRNTLTYQTQEFENDQIKNSQMAVDTSLNERTLDVDTMNATVQSQTALVPFLQNTPVRFLRGGSQYALWYLSEIRRIAGDLYSLSMTSSLGRLTQMEHKGGIYNGVAASVVIDDICGVVPHFVGAAFQNVLLYGWLPYVAPSGENGAQTGSAKDNLLKVLFALNATVRDDANGTLRIENLSTAVSAQLDADRIYRDNASVLTEPAVTGVTVLEHQYITGSETTTLFEGATVDGQVIVFREPMSNLTATGFSVTESGANYAVVSAGSGTLTGTPYIHTTREITKPVTTTIHTLVGVEETFRAKQDPHGVYILNPDAVWTVTVGNYGDLHFTFTGPRITAVFTGAIIRTHGEEFAEGTVTLKSTAPGGATYEFALFAGASEISAKLPFILEASSPYYEDVPIEVPNVVRIEDATLVGVTNSADVVNRLVDYYSHRTYINVDATIDFEDAGDVVEIYDPFDKVLRQACIEKISPLVVSQTMKGRVSALVGFTPWQVEPFEDVRELLTGSGTWTASGIPVGTEITVVLIGKGYAGQAGEDGQSAARNIVAEVGSGTWSSGAKKGGDGGAGGEGGEGGRVLRVSFVLTSEFSAIFDATGENVLFGDYSSESGVSADAGYYDPVAQVTYAAKGTNGVPGAKGGNGNAIGGSGYKGEDVDQFIGGYGSGSYSGSGGTTGSTATFGGNGGGGAASGQNGGNASHPGGGKGADAEPPQAPTGYGTGGTGGNGGGGGGGAGAIRATGTGYGTWAVNEGGGGGSGSLGSAGAPGCIILYYRKPVTE